MLTSCDLDTIPTTYVDAGSVFGKTGDAEKVLNGGWNYLMETFNSYANPGYGAMLRANDAMGSDIELFNFYLKMPIKKEDENSVYAYPGAIFMPFYIDQDKGWSGSWDSFADVFTGKWKQEILLYHMVIYALSDFLIMILSWLVKQSLRAFLFQEVQP